MQVGRWAANGVCKIIRQPQGGPRSLVGQGWRALRVKALAFGKWLDEVMTCIHAALIGYKA